MGSEVGLCRRNCAARSSWLRSGPNGWSESEHHPRRGNQYEPAVAIAPDNNDLIFVVSRSEKGGLYTARSGDGGATWTSRLIGQMPVSNAGDIPRA